MNKRIHKTVNPDSAIERLLKENKLTFREGFTDRTLQKILNMQEEINNAHFYFYLSRLLPRIAFLSVILIGVLLISAYLLNGGIDHKILLGAERVNESNFISYLILKK